MMSHRADPVRSKVLRAKPGPVARHVGPAQLGTTNPLMGVKGSLMGGVGGWVKNPIS
jgi:hypothetical protein